MGRRALVVIKREGAIHALVVGKNTIGDITLVTPLPVIITLESHRENLCY